MVYSNVYAELDSKHKVLGYVFDKKTMEWIRFTSLTIFICYYDLPFLLKHWLINSLFSGKYDQSNIFWQYSIQLYLTYIFHKFHLFGFIVYFERTFLFLNFSRHYMAEYCHKSLFNQSILNFSKYPIWIDIFKKTLILMG